MSTAHNYEHIVKEALTEPGKLNQAYRAFWNYSVGNQFLTMMQLPQAEPINTYNGWQKLGRHVKKGEKAISLIMPVTSKDKTTNEVNGVFFVARKNWFGLSQTEGEPYVAPAIPDFDLDRALNALEITKESFKIVDGNCQGYAKPLDKKIAISEIASNPIKTALHEMGHVLLHGEEIVMNDSPTLTRDVREVEAELTAYICLSVLGQTNGLEYSRGYIASWNSGNTGEKVRYGKVFAAVDKILKAGRPQQEKGE